MGKIRVNKRQLAIAQGLFVAFLWSTSWVMIKIGLADIPPLTFAGLRFTLGFVFLLIWFLATGGYKKLRTLTRSDWLFLTVLGVLLYTVTQGAQFVGLDRLPAASVNLIMNMTSIMVALAGIVFLKEKPAPLQWLGVFISIAGAVVYFTPLDIPAGGMIGVLVVFSGMLTQSASQLMGRRVNTRSALSPTVITVVSMGIGSPLLLAAGAFTQGIPRIDLTGWFFIVWMALVNTAFAFTVYNITLRTLTVVESSLTINTMILYVPLQAWLFLGEELSLKSIIGLLCVALGVVLVQVGHRSPVPGRSSPEHPPAA